MVALVPPAFSMNALLKVHAITRVKVLRFEPFALYVDFLQIDPSAPPSGSRSASLRVLARARARRLRRSRRSAGRARRCR
jgi:hypothetical protein